MISSTTHFLFYCTATLYSKRTLPSATVMQMVPPRCSRQAPVKPYGITSLGQKNSQQKKQFYKTNGYIFAFSNYLLTSWTTPQDTEVFRQSSLKERQSLQEEYVGNCRKLCKVQCGNTTDGRAPGKKPDSQLAGLSSKCFLLLHQI